MAALSLTISTAFAVIDPTTRPALQSNIALVIGAYLSLVDPTKGQTNRDDK